jgi:hypothetical protein
MKEWTLISIAKVLAGLSMCAAGMIMVAIILGFSVPHGRVLMFTCIILMVLSAGIVIIRQQQCKQTPPVKT